MKTGMLPVSRWTLCLLFTAVIGIIYNGGCSENKKMQTKSYSKQDAADSEFQKGADKPPTAKTLFSMAEILAAQGKDAECENILKQSITAYPDFVPAYNSLAELNMRQGRVNDAIVTITRGLQLNSRDTVLLNNLGMCWIVRRDYNKALDAFTEASGISPENAKYRANMAAALGLLGRYEESLSLFKQILPPKEAEHNLSVLRAVREDSNPNSAVNLKELNLKNPK